MKPWERNAAAILAARKKRAAGRSGRVFTLRLRPEDERHFRDQMEAARDLLPPLPAHQTYGLGTFILWAAKRLNIERERESRGSSRK